MRLCRQGASLNAPSCLRSVILLLALHLCLFTMIGMLLFAKTEVGSPLGSDPEDKHLHNTSEGSGACSGS